VPVAFNDASFNFSEEEWKSLNEWQKELYRHIMKGNYEAVISMGKDGLGFALSLLVRQEPSERLGREEEGKREDPQAKRGCDCPLSPTKIRKQPVTRTNAAISKPDLLSRIEQGEDPNAEDPDDSEGGETPTDPSTEFSFPGPDDSSWSKYEETLAESHEGSEEEESMEVPSTCKLEAQSFAERCTEGEIEAGSGSWHLLGIAG
ncbi:PREDICTED: zinc finger protein 398-like, partial [Fulmarus glacialis]|uniref:zinc finger protein 398-like n=1 Tax=Fulmarus glacialis TaxID=30455 RepID=UPI00051B1300